MRILPLACLLAAAVSSLAIAQTPVVVLTQPTQNALSVSAFVDVSVTFDLDMNASTINDTTFLVRGASSGPHGGAVSYDAPSRTATFDPLADFMPGERVVVVLTTDIESASAESLAGYAWTFTSAADGGDTLAQRTDYDAGSSPSSVFAADLDADDDADLVTANYSSDNVSVLLNAGDGTFAPQVVYSTGGAPWSVFAADLDGDGDLDLAVANRADDSVSVLLNHGDGTFAAHTTFGAGDEPMSVVACDLDADGDLDLATSNYQSGDVVVLLNGGDATFGPAASYGVGALAYSVVAADLDGDGLPDLAATSVASDNAYVLLNDGDGTFAPAAAYGTGGGPRTIVACDLDGDGDLDLATANELSDDVSVLANQGGGTFAAHEDYAAGDYPISLVACDLDGDGDLDVVTADYNTDDLSVLRNDGNGTLGAASFHAVGGDPRCVFAADLNGDGTVDLASANGLSNDASVIPGARIPCVVATVPTQHELDVSLSSNITVTFDASVDAATINDTTFLVSGMVSGPHAGVVTYDEPSRTASLDPATDFEAGEIVTAVLTSAVRSPLDMSVSPYIWSFRPQALDGSGTLGDIVGHQVSGGQDSLASVCAADLDRDGDVDLAATVFGSYSTDTRFAVLENLGDGTFGSASDYSIVSGVSLRTPMVTADVDGDGHIDLVAGYIDADSSKISIALNAGDGTFGSPTSYLVGVEMPLTSIFAADIDGDGDIDLITTELRGLQSGTVSVLRNSGSGVFGAPTSYSLNGLLWDASVFATDLDGDADVDLAVATCDLFQDAHVWVLKNTGNGTFGDATGNHSGYGTRSSLFGADLDSDGDVDLAFIDSNDGAVSVVLNAGNGTFGGVVDYSLGPLASPVSVFAADIDGDGDVDLTAPIHDGSGGYVCVLRNAGDGTFDGPAHYSLGSTMIPSSMFAADTDGDGDVDVAVAGKQFETPSSNLILLKNIDSGPLVSATPSLLVFNDVPFGETSCDTVRVSNHGDSTCVVSSISGCDTGPFSLDTTMTDLELAQGETTEFVVCVTPTGAGPDSCVVTIESDAVNGPTVVPVQLGVVTGVEPDETAQPFRIVSVAPNPFNPSTTLHFTLPGRMAVSVEVFSVAGGRVRVLADEVPLGPGDVRLTWDGRTERGLPAASGVYFMRVKTRLGEKRTPAVLLK